MAQGSRSTRADARRNQERLLRAARELLAERGLAVEINEIAARAKIGSGTIYRNYRNKEALILEVAREMSRKTTEELLTIAATVRDARECVAQTMRVGFQRAKEYGQLAILLVGGSAPPPYSDAVNPKVLGRFFEVLIRRGIDQGHFRADLDVEYAVSVWFALVAPPALGRLRDTHSFDEIASLTTEFFLAGISVAPPQAERNDA